jgi:hypothetical protein
MVAALGITGSLFWPYLNDALVSQWFPIAGLLLGILETAYLRLRLLAQESVARQQGDAGILYVALLILLWVAALIAGNVLHEIS